ncbi:MAG: galactokinase [Saprospiraceae bacterium]|nr:galactokinase [Saprospiraceae bacterium]
MELFEEQINKHFQEHFGRLPAFFVKAPGRINLIGEHTDYNMGLALPAAVDKHILFGFAKNGSKDTCRFLAIDMNAREEVRLGQLTKSDQSWSNYLLGVLEAFAKRNISLPGFDCVFCGNIPIGGGLSSSAALECGFARGLDQLAGEYLDNWELVKIGQETENDYLGVQSGILDQFSSVFGQAKKAMLLDCRSQTFSYINADFQAYQLVLFNSKVKHEHTDSGYNSRPEECRKAVSIIQNKYPEIKSLRDVNDNILAECETTMPNKLFRRSQFVVHENARVRAFCRAFHESDFELLGKILYQSHFGLQYFYDVSCKELDLLVDLTRGEEAVLGARMMGGGFGGCSINIIRKSDLTEVKERILSQYKEKTGILAEAYEVSIEDGVQVK